MFYIKIKLIIDSSTVPAYLLEIFERVRQSADYMPTFQVHRQLETELGLNWRQLFKEFDERPFAAASIGQVKKIFTLNNLKTLRFTKVLLWMVKKWQ